MKLLSLLMWVGQFGFSIIFPVLFFLILGGWLQTRYDLGIWVTVISAILGILTTISTTRSCLHSLRKAAEEASGAKDIPIGFNDHK